MVDNEYIATGYRINFNSIRKILKSLFIVHNESVNVWSHLLGSILFLAMILYTYLYMAPHGGNWSEESKLALRSEDTKALSQLLKELNNQSDQDHLLKKNGGHWLNMSSLPYRYAYKNLITNPALETISLNFRANLNTPQYLSKSRPTSRELCT
jgi:hypothetical protein